MEVTQDQTSSPLSEGIKHIPSTAILCSAQPHGCPSLDFLPVCPQTQSRACLVPEKEGDHRKKLCFTLALESTTRLDWRLNRDGNDRASGSGLRRLHLGRERGRIARHLKLARDAEQIPVSGKPPNKAKPWLGLTILAQSDESSKMFIHPLLEEGVPALSCWLSFPNLPFYTQWCWHSKTHFWFASCVPLGALRGSSCAFERRRRDYGLQIPHLLPVLDNHPSTYTGVQQVVFLVESDSVVQFATKSSSLSPLPGTNMTLCIFIELESRIFCWSIVKIMLSGYSGVHLKSQHSRGWVGSIRSSRSTSVT